MVSLKATDEDAAPMTIDIPVIDLTPFRAGTAAGKASVARAVAAAWETVGFLVVDGHGVDERGVPGGCRKTPPATTCECGLGPRE